MLIAQALGEYFSVSAVANAVTTTLSTARSFLMGLDARTWAILGLGLFLGLYLFNRRK